MRSTECHVKVREKFVCERSLLLIEYGCPCGAYLDKVANFNARSKLF